MILELLQKLHYGLSARADVEFFVDVLKMRANGVDADREMFGDFLGRIALGKLLQDFFFALRKLFVLERVVGGFAEGADDQPRDLAAHGRATLLNLLDR